MQKKYAFVLCLCSCLMCFLLSSCGTKISESDIANYLNEVYAGSMTVDEVKDITEEPGDARNVLIITCTATLSNKYAQQTANYILRFEHFNDMWVGTDNEMGYKEYQIINDITEEDFAAIAFSECVPDARFDILDIETDRDNGVATANILSYTFYDCYYFRDKEIATVNWSERTMRWVRSLNNTNNLKSVEGGSEFVWATDLTAHYEKSYKNAYLSFDIEYDDISKTYKLKNYVNHYINSYMPYYEHKYTVDEIQMDFVTSDYTHWNGYDIAFRFKAKDSLHSEEAIMSFYIDDLTLYYEDTCIWYNSNCVIKDLASGSYDEFSGLWPGTWAGNY